VKGMPPLTLVVGAGTCGLSVGAADTLRALRDEIARRKLSARVVAGGCNGMCWAAPVVTVLRGDEAPRVIPRVTAGQAAALLATVSAGTPPQHADVTAFLKGIRRGVEVYYKLRGLEKSRHRPPPRRVADEDEHLFI